MFVWKQWRKEMYHLGHLESAKDYRILLLFGFIPLFIAING